MLAGAKDNIVQSLLYPSGSLSPLEIDDAVTRALAEDLGRAGDVTSIATIPEMRCARAVVARKAGIIAGLPLLESCLPGSRPTSTSLPRRATAMRSRPRRRYDHRRPARAVLSAERAALNFLGHLSGIATATAAYVRKIGNAKTRICCTRKTTPGLRALEKYAIRCGGGFNHRFGLDDAILIKDNHIAVAGGIHPVLARPRAPPAIWSRSRSRWIRLTSCKRCWRPGSLTWCCSTTSTSRR